MKEFCTKSQITCGLLIPAISEKFNNLLPDVPMDPSEIWTNLCGHFESKSPFHIPQIHRQLHAMDLTKREDEKRPSVMSAKGTDIWPETMQISDSLTQNHPTYPTTHQLVIPSLLLLLHIACGKQPVIALVLIHVSFWTLVPHLI